MRCKHAEPLIAELLSLGATRCSVKAGGKHLKLEIEFAGRKFSYPIPCTPSDWRWLCNARRDLYRILGVRREIRKSARPRSRHHVSAPSVPLLPCSFTVKSDPFAVLKRLERAPDPSPAEASDRAAAPERVPLRTPWLGRRRRWQCAVTAATWTPALEQIVLDWQPGDQPVLARDAEGHRFWAWLRREHEVVGCLGDFEADPLHPWSAAEPEREAA